VWQIDAPWPGYPIPLPRGGKRLALVLVLFYFLAPVRRGSAVVVPEAGAIWLSLHFFDGHRAIFQERDDLCAIYLQAPVVADQALLLELVHEFTHPWAGGTNHLRQG